MEIISPSNSGDTERLAEDEAERVTRHEGYIRELFLCEQSATVSLCGCKCLFPVRQILFVRRQPVTVSSLSQPITVCVWEVLNILFPLFFLCIFFFFLSPQSFQSPHKHCCFVSLPLPTSSFSLLFIYQLPLPSFSVPNCLR